MLSKVWLGNDMYVFVLAKRLWTHDLLSETEASCVIELFLTLDDRQKKEVVFYLGTAFIDGVIHGKHVDKAPLIEANKQAEKWR